MIFTDRIDVFRVEHRLSQSEFERNAGLSKGLLPKWRKGLFYPNHRSQIKLANYMQIPLDVLMSDEPDPSSNTRERNTSDQFINHMPALEWNSAEYTESDNYRLTIMDNSMTPVLTRGDTVTVHRQNNAGNGDYVIVRTGSEILCRRLLKQAEGIILQPTEEGLEPVYYTTRDISTLPVIILGKIIESRHTFK